MKSCQYVQENSNFLIYILIYILYIYISIYLYIYILIIYILLLGYTVISNLENNRNNSMLYHVRSFLRFVSES